MPKYKPPRQSALPQPDIRMLGYKFINFAPEYRFSHYVATNPLPRKMSLGLCVHVKDCERPTSAGSVGLITALNTREKGWIAWTLTTARGRAVEISIPYHESDIPASVDAQYRANFSCMPDRLRTTFPQYLKLTAPSTADGTCERVPLSAEPLTKKNVHYVAPISYHRPHTPTDPAWRIEATGSFDRCVRRDTDIYCVLTAVLLAGPNIFQSLDQQARLAQNKAS